MTTACAVTPIAVAIERKSKSDLVACVGPEREGFLEQMQSLPSYQVRALVVESLMGGTRQRRLPVGHEPVVRYVPNSAA